MLIFKSVGFKSSEAVNVKRMGAKVKSRTKSDISGQNRTAICGVDVFLQRVRERIRARDEKTKVNDGIRGLTTRYGGLTARHEG